MSISFKVCTRSKVLARRVSSGPMDDHFWKKYKENSLKGAVSQNSAKLGNYKIPVKLRERLK